MGAHPTNTRRGESMIRTRGRRRAAWALAGERRAHLAIIDSGGEVAAVEFPPRLGPNLAQGGFSATSSRSEAKSGQESARHTDQNTQTGGPGARGGRKVRTMLDMTLTPPHAGHAYTV